MQETPKLRTQDLSMTGLVAQNTAPAERALDSAAMAAVTTAEALPVAEPVAQAPAMGADVIVVAQATASAAASNDRGAAAVVPAGSQGDEKKDDKGAAVAGDDEDGGGWIWGLLGLGLLAAAGGGGSSSPAPEPEPEEPKPEEPKPEEPEPEEPEPVEPTLLSDAAGSSVKTTDGEVFTVQGTVNTPFKVMADEEGGSLALDGLSIDLTGGNGEFTYAGTLVDNTELVGDGTFSLLAGGLSENKAQFSVDTTDLLAGDLDVMLIWDASPAANDDYAVVFENVGDSGSFTIEGVTYSYSYTDGTFTVQPVEPVMPV